MPLLVSGDLKPTRVLETARCMPHVSGHLLCCGDAEEHGLLGRRLRANVWQ